MTAALPPFYLQHFFDPNNTGVPLQGGKLFTYVAGTSTKQGTWTDATQAVLNSNPIILDSRGECSMWLDPTLMYKLVLCAANDTDPPTSPIATQDDVSGAVTLGFLTQQVVGGILFPLTVAEFAAGVTPANYAYPPGDVRRYGAVGDGVTDDTTAAQNALNVARYGQSRVHFPSCNKGVQTVYLVGSALNPELLPYENTYITADPGVILLKGSSTVFTNIFNCQSTFAASTLLTGNVTRGQNSLTVISAAGLSVGQLVEIFDQTFKYGSNGHNLELNEIKAIVGTTITLENPFIGDYTTGNSAALKGATQAARNIRFENVTMRIATGGDGGGIIFQDAYLCLATNCRVIGPRSQPGFLFWRSAYCRGRGLITQDGQQQATPGYGYGSAAGSSAHDCAFEDCFFLNVRENAFSDNVRFCAYVNCIAVGAADNGFNTHASGAEDCLFLGCRSYYATSKGFVTSGSNAADIRIRFIACESYFSGYIAFWSGADAGRENQDIEFIDCKAFSPGTNTSTSFGFYVNNNTRPKIINCRVDAQNQANVRAGIMVQTCTDAVVRGGEILNVDPNWGLIHDTCTNVEISGVRFQAITAQQVHSTGTPSTGVWVHDNRGSTGSYTRNSGDLWQNNYWAGNPDNDNNVVTYSASMTPDFSLGHRQSITANNGTAFAINAPSNAPTIPGPRMTVIVRNAAGGALGAATWAATYKLAAWTQPASANSRSIDFEFDGTNWVECSRTAADVPN